MRLTSAIVFLTLAFDAPAFAQAPDGVPPAAPSAEPTAPPLPPPLPEAGAWLAPGPGRTVRLALQTTTPGVRLIDVGRGVEVCEGRCGLMVSAEPSQRYLLRVEGWEDSESFTLSRFTRAVVVSYGGANPVMRKLGLGLLIGGGALLAASALAWVVAFVWALAVLFSGSSGLNSYFAVMPTVTAVTASVGAASLVTGFLLRFLGGQTRLELREDASPP